MPSYSIVIETDNLVGHSRKLLWDCLTALDKQTLHPSTANEVVVIYTEADPRVEHELARAFPWLTLHATPKPLLYEDIKRLGTKITTGDLVLFLDSDCFPEPQWTAAMLSAFEDPTVSAVAGDTAMPPVNPLALATSVCDVFYPFSTRTEVHDDRHYYPDNVAMRRSVLEAHPWFEVEGFYRHSFHTETLIKNGHRIVRQPLARVAHKEVPWGWLAQRFFHLGRDSVRWRAAHDKPQTTAGVLKLLAKVVVWRGKISLWKAPKLIRRYPKAAAFLPFSLPIMAVCGACYLAGIAAATVDWIDTPREVNGDALARIDR